MRKGKLIYFDKDDLRKGSLDIRQSKLTPEDLNYEAHQALKEADIALYVGGGISATVMKSRLKIK